MTVNLTQHQLTALIRKIDGKPLDSRDAARLEECLSIFWSARTQHANEYRAHLAMVRSPAWKAATE